MTSAAAVAAHADPAATATVDAHVASGSNDPIRPLLVKTVTFRTAPVQSASLTPMPSLVAVAVPAPQPAAARAQLPPSPADQRMVVASAEPTPVAAPAAAPAYVAPVPPAAAAKSEAALPEPAKHEPIAAPTKVEIIPKPEVAASVPSVPAATPSIPSGAPAHVHGGWLIQIGAFDGEDEARQHLSDAQVKVHSALAAADPFTERVQKGDKALYRARFAGFDKDAAEAACKQLKRSDFDCMALKD
jgi:D-alanyl-D-alanine carboxypeptidase